MEKTTHIVPLPISGSPWHLLNSRNPGKAETEVALKEKNKYLRGLFPEVWLISDINQPDCGKEVNVLEEYKVHKENRRKKVGKRRERMKVHGAGLRRIPQIWKEKSEKIDKKGGDGHA